MTDSNLGCESEGPDSAIRSQALRLAELDSERTRVRTLLGVVGGLLSLVLIRGFMALLEGRRGEAWPFAVLLVITAGYELLWLKSVRRAIASNHTVSHSKWMMNILVESL